jgi:YfiH family protein
MGWEWKQGKTIDFLTIPHWTQLGAEVAFSARRHGVSASPYAALNLGLHVGDDPARVLQNRNLFLAEFGQPLAGCTAARQVHGTTVVTVTEADRGRGMREAESALPDCDGMVTGSDTALMAFYADCVPLFFFEPACGMVGLAHAGWRGTAHNIVKEVMNKLRTAGGKAEACLAAIGPCIGSCCYEVGEEVAICFRENFHQVLTASAPGKYRLDLVRANFELLVAAGIKPENIAVANLCTACRQEHFYSYRRDGVTGRMAALIRKRKGGF